MWESSLPFSAPTPTKHDRSIMAVLGPGMMACLADSDVGGLLTMAVSGSRCGYVLLPLQLLLIPVLYMAQELTVRLGACSHRSLSGLAFDHLGKVWGFATFLACLGVGSTAIVSQFTGVAAVGELWGVSRSTSCCLSAALLGIIVLRSDFRSVERLSLVLASSLVVFIVLGLFCHPTVDELQTPFSIVLKQPELRKIVAANIGTVITPWMLFFQLSAVVEKRLVPADLRVARADTAIGAVATQVVMVSVLMTFARLARGTDVEHMPLHAALVEPLQPLVGEFCARLLMSCGLLGSSMLATIVASMAIAWNCADVLGSRGTSSLAWRLGVLVSVAFGALMIGFNVANIVRLNVAIQVVNGLSMPLVVGVLFFVSRSDALPPALRLQGCYGTTCGVVFAISALITLSCAFF
eukprot:CAMPEP_0169314002 /NCGR_PEP_ID=MMETSP1017-20121227/4876_1 /TAXON_ID=342587 /ORGANISM="Karlodinium micrum, Strain CCMP2283" /LENGTH=408 /DNA_ID=CAMNT_0009407893 /DNA_START=57 /DNA_END=1283 /DNA_ORIENTATION=+